MGKADDFVAKMKAADSERDFSWRRLKDVERERPTFTVVPQHYDGGPSMVSSVGDDGQLVVGDNMAWVPRERAIAWAHWILEVYGVRAEGAATDGSAD